MISFIIPAKNEEDYIGSCLASIFMQSTNEVFEVIVVDNGSTDKTQKVIKEKFSEVKVIEEKISGTNAARQKGFLEASGELLIFLDADVRLPDKDWLNRVLKKMQRSNIVALSSHYRYYDLSPVQNFFQIVGTFGIIYPWLFLVNNILRTTATMVGGIMVITKNALNKVGGFNSRGQFFGDEASVSMSLYKLGKIVISPQIWVWTSGRRYEKQGMFTAVFHYVFNYFFVLFTGQPYHKTGYKEFR
jgi:glycosyltransferase involved in cell wall biosynthesis